VPVLVTGSEILPDSHSIVRWATAHGSDRLYPVEAGVCGKVLEVERYVDRELGPHVRRWAYSYLLGEPGLLTPCFARNVTRLERLLAPMVVQAARPLIRRAYRVDEATGRASLARAEEALAEVATWLADGRTYLVGDSFTAADLAFASLAAPLVCAPQYGGAMPPYDSLPAPMPRTSSGCGPVERVHSFLSCTPASGPNRRAGTPRIGKTLASAEVSLSRVSGVSLAR
jgi:glutathione S-transferase